MKRIALAAVLLALSAAASSEPLWVGRFTGEGALPAGWQIEQPSKKFPPTEYRQRPWDGVAAIEARAAASMALLVRPLTVDLEKTPILCWRWRIDAPLRNANLATRAGDDYAARVYVSFSVPPESLGLSTRAALAVARSLWGPTVPDAAINYVWDNTHPVGTLRPNAYTERTRMLVLRSGAGDAGGWVSERRHLREDFRSAFGDLPGRPNGLAIASDTDNTGESARAGFADFHLVADGAPCAFADR